jgi:hypothetical protein
MKEAFNSKSSLPHHWNAVSAYYSPFCCLHRDVSLVHHVQCYAFQTWKLLSYVWTEKNFARDPSTLAKLGKSEYKVITHMMAQRKNRTGHGACCRTGARATSTRQPVLSRPQEIVGGSQGLRA